ncbi:hypothetical protein NW752_009201 [Fusarium irregulare]|uniref:Uncharacterized protein n=1 Tax=Fusarium irregulare TaxID=2494466 RepID=A0A9W8PL55_9HYPO|nr:hypothetical protein NW766_008732 [Fusarium irregulare]KAJ4010024.1 hypothetical protein NW752_009201 [Fusarium irregulare]
MSWTFKLTVSTALARFPFNRHAGFIGQKAGEWPCYHCVVSLHQDPRGLCVVEEGSTNRCLWCADAGKPCCAIPEELLGAAQKIWNGYLAHVLHDKKWTGLQRWRIDKFFGELTSTFQSVYEILLNPERPMTYDGEDSDPNHVQEVARQRGSMCMMVSAVHWVEHTVAEIPPEVVALFPAFFADCVKIDNLRKQLWLIAECRNTPVPGEEPTSNLDEFRMTHKEELVTLALDNGTSAPKVTDRTP